MRFEVWAQFGDELDTTSLVMFPAMNRDNEGELIKKGFSVVRAIDAKDEEEARRVLADWVSIRAILVGEARTRDAPPRLTDVRCCSCAEPVVCPRGHNDGVMGVGEPPELLPFDEDARKAIEKHRKSGKCPMAEPAERCLAVIQDMMPNIANGVVQNYQELNEAPTSLRKAIDDGCSDVVKMDTVHVVFDGPPGHESGRFVETEDSEGHGISAGEWVEIRGCWHLVIERPQLGDDYTNALEDDNADFLERIKELNAYVVELETKLKDVPCVVEGHESLEKAARLALDPRLIKEKP